MINPSRMIDKYDPIGDAERHSSWTIQQVNLSGIGEVFDRRTRVILIDSTFPPDAALAHAIAHLDLGHTESEGHAFTEQQEMDADYLAGIRLDEEGSRRECA